MTCENFADIDVYDSGVRYNYLAFRNTYFDEFSHIILITVAQLIYESCASFIDVILCNRLKIFDKEILYRRNLAIR